MAFNISGLSAYYELKSKEIASKAISGAQTAKMLIDAGAVQAGAKGKVPVLKMDVDAVFQDGSSCGRTASGTVTLANTFIDVRPIKSVADICSKSLWNTHYSYALKVGSNPENEGFAEGFAEHVADKRVEGVQSEVEKLLWQGAVHITGSSNLKYTQGILIQATSGSTVVAGGADMVAKLQNAYSSASIDVKSKDDFRVFVGEDTAATYKLHLANKNIYQPTEDLTVFGTTAKIAPVAGLNGTNRIYLTRISNLQLGLDGSDDTDKAIMRYSVESENWYSDIYLALGVAVIYPEQGYLATV